MTDVCLVQITANGSDLACYLNGSYVISADPGCGDDTSAVGNVAESLATIYKTTVRNVPYNPVEDWGWDSVSESLRDSNLLPSEHKVSFVDLSSEAKEIAIGMIAHCINQGDCMGMDEGFASFDPDIKHPFRLELERFVETNCQLENYWENL